MLTVRTAVYPQFEPCLIVATICQRIARARRVVRHGRLLEFESLPAQVRRPHPATEGALDQVHASGRRDVMSKIPQQSSNKTRPGWVYLGATAILQPLSEEFLYRAAQNRAEHTCCWRLRRRSEADDADA